MTRIAFTLLFHSVFAVLHLCSAWHQAKQGGKHKAVLDGQDPGEVKTTWGNRIYKHSTESWLLLANVSRWDVERKSGHVWHMPVVGTDPQLNCSRPKTHASRWDSCLFTLSVPCGVLRLQPWQWNLPYSTFQELGPGPPWEAPLPAPWASGGAPAATPASPSVGQALQFSKHSNMFPLCLARGILCDLQPRAS